MIQRVALCILCLGLVAQTSASQPAISQKRVHPETKTNQGIRIENKYEPGNTWRAPLLITTPRLLAKPESPFTGDVLQSRAGPTGDFLLAYRLVPEARNKEAQRPGKTPGKSPQQALVQKLSTMHSLSGRSEGSLPSVNASVGQWMPMTATWYDGQEGINGTGDGITASGARVQAGVTIAVDPSLIPLGSIVEVKFPNGTSHMYKAEDVGGAIKGHHIDIYNPSPQYCVQQGRQHVLIRIWHTGH